MCGERVQVLQGASCAEEAFAGQEQTTTAQFGEPLMLKA
jgi:hypothetical protein